MNKFIQKIVPALFLVVFIFSQNAFSDDFNWVEGEELVYGVHYTFIRLGTVTLNVLERDSIANQEVYHLRLETKSNPLLFWLSNQSVYETYVNKNLQTIRFLTDENIDGQTYHATYDFNYDNYKIDLKMRAKEDSTKIIEKQVDFKPGLIDGIGLIFYARANVTKTERDTVTTFIEDKKGDVAFNFTGKTEEIDIDAVDHDLKSNFFDGQVFITGIAGVTGPYKGWFSTDNQHVPLKAKLKVFIGSVSLELESWKNWSPE